MKELGFIDKITDLIHPSDYDGFELGRVIVEHKERYIIQSEEGSFSAEITGNLRFSANSRAEFPAVGDWVKFTKMDEKNAIILEVFPRISVLERQAVGTYADVQIIATNIDYGFVVQSVGHDFNLKRLERYLTICNSSKITPIILLTKIDLVSKEEVYSLLKEINERVKKVQIFAISNETKIGLEELNSIMEPHKTYCFMGSSGVGKSTIVNNLQGETVLKTNSISTSTNKGKHTTSHRELFILPNKSIVIDTPGMRELGLTEQAKGIDLTYEQITDLAKDCKFNDCTHTNEYECAVLNAIESGELSEEAFQNYQKLKREESHFSSTVQEKRKKDKDFGKMIKTILNEKKKNKFRD